MGLFKKLLSVFQGESEEDEIEDISSVSEQEEEAAAIKKKAEEEAAAIKKKAEEEAAAIKKKVEEEAAAIKKKAEEEAAAKKKAEKEAAAKKKAEKEAAAKKKAEKEAAGPTIVDYQIARQLTDDWKKTDITLPASVCEITWNAFHGNNFLEAIDMSSCNNLKKICEESFQECYRLKEIVFPEKLEEVEDYAFFGCKALTIIDLSNCKKLHKICTQSFSGCENLQKIILPENIEEIGELAFSNCVALTSIDLSNCKKLEKIDVAAFNYCTSLEEILLPESLSFIGQSAFAYCKFECVDFSACKQLTKLPTDLFNKCKSLEEIVWPPHLKEIGDIAFSKCESLRRVELPDSVEVLGEDIFLGCKLKSLSLPKNIKKLPVLTVALRAEAQIKSLDMSRCKNLKVLTAPITCSSKTIVFPIGVEEIETAVFKYNKPGQFESIFLPPTIKEVELNNSADDANVYCYARELENVKDIIEKCACLLVLPQYYDSYYDQAVAEGAEGCLDKIPEDKLYFYDE